MKREVFFVAPTAFLTNYICKPDLDETCRSTREVYTNPGESQQKGQKFYKSEPETKRNLSANDESGFADTKPCVNNTQN